MTRRARALALAALVTVAAACGDNGANGGAPDVNDPDAPPATAPGGAPSFPLPADPAGQIRAAGLRELDDDAVVTTAQAHVDVIIDGHAVTVPAGIGTTPNGGRSPLSTAADDGVVRIDTEVVEGDDDPPLFTLGQLFTQWGVRLDKSCVATYCADDANQLLGFVNGQLVGDPASIALFDEEQIVVWFGPRGTNPPVPVTYDFPPLPSS